MPMSTKMSSRSTLHSFNSSLGSGSRSGSPTRPEVVSSKLKRCGTDIFNPTPEDFLDMWAKTSTDEPLRDVNHLFSSNSYRHWYLREQYPPLLKAIINDDRRRVQVIHGAKGIGKSVFLLYFVALLRKIRSKPVLLWLQANGESPLMLFLDTDGKTTLKSVEVHQWKEWLGQVTKADSYVLVDGVASFPRHSVGRGSVRYVVADSGEGLGTFEHDLIRHRWLKPWTQSELMQVGMQLEIDAEQREALKQNIYYAGERLARFAFIDGAGKQRSEDALLSVQAIDVLDVMQKNLWGTNKGALANLIQYEAPKSLMGLKGFRYDFASNYVARWIGYKLQLECPSRKLDTIVPIYRDLCVRSGFPEAGFTGFAVRKLSGGGAFRIRRVGKDKTQFVPLAFVNIDVTEEGFDHQLENNKDQLVWFEQDYDSPPRGSIDAITFHNSLPRIFQMVHEAPIADPQGWDLVQLKKCIKFLDNNKKQKRYDCFWCVPHNLFDDFVPDDLPYLRDGEQLDDPGDEAIALKMGKRVDHWVLEIQ